MKPSFDFGALGKSKPWEYVVRFLFGGVVTVAAGLVAREWGPVVGGLFLAFPAILPASLTLVKEHDGRARAIDDARGGRLGSIGLVAFALVAWWTARHWPAIAVLATATLVWAVVDVALWGLKHRGERGR